MVIPCSGNLPLITDQKTYTTLYNYPEQGLFFMNDFIKRFRELNPQLFLSPERKIKGISRKQYFREYMRKYREENTSSLSPYSHVIRSRNRAVAGRYIR
jgi:hypothetical protein